MGKLKTLELCAFVTLLIFVLPGHKINAENFSVLDRFHNGDFVTVTILGKVEADKSTVVCKGEGLKNFAMVTCSSQKKCDDWLPCLKNPTRDCKRSGVSVGTRVMCPPPPAWSYENDDDTCRSIERQNLGNPLKERFRVERYCCTRYENGRTGAACGYHFSGEQHREKSLVADAVLSKQAHNLELKIFNGSSAVRANSSQSQIQVVNLFSSEEIFVQCRVAKGIFHEPLKSPITVRHKNGSLIEIGPAPEMKDTLKYWEFSYKEFVVGKEMTGISCLAKKINASLENAEEHRFIDFKVTDPEFPPLIRKAGAANVEVEVGDLLSCYLLDFFQTQKDIFLYAVQEHGVNVSNQTKLTSFAGFSRLLQLAYEMDVNLQCRKTSSTWSDNADFFVQIANITSLNSTLTIDTKTMIIDKEAADPIRCKFTGLPPFSVVWLQNNHSIQFSWGKKLNENNSRIKLRRPAAFEEHYSTLEMPPIPQNSSGLSYTDSYPTFSCLVSNFRGIIRHDFITATTPKIKRSLIFQNSTFENVTFTWRKEEPENITTACIFKGGPTTSVKWTYDGIAVDDSVPVNTVDDSAEYYRSEMITDLSRVEGEAVRRKYVCTVSNSFGNDTLEFRLFGRRLMEGEPEFHDGDDDDDADNGQNSIFFYVAFSLFIVVLILFGVFVIQCRRIEILQPKAKAFEACERIRLEEKLDAFLPPTATLSTALYPVIDRDMEEQLEQFLPSAPPSAL